MHMHMGLIPLRVSGIWASMNMLVHMRRSECEWHFVADPMSGLTTLGLSSYPEEGRSIDSASAGTEPEARLSWNQIGGLQSHVIVTRRFPPQVAGSTRSAFLMWQVIPTGARPNLLRSLPPRSGR